MIMENMIQMGYILLIMCCVLILIAMVTQLHKKRLEGSLQSTTLFFKETITV